MLGFIWAGAPGRLFGTHAAWLPWLSNAVVSVAVISITIAERLRSTRDDHAELQRRLQSGKPTAGASPRCHFASRLRRPAADVADRAAVTIRIASFNIQVFGDSKASKPYVMQTLAAIIRNFQIVAIQEIRTKNDYHLDNFLRDYVNQGVPNRSRRPLLRLCHRPPAWPHRQQGTIRLHLRHVGHRAESSRASTR